jgi:23S rRNA (guanosine2251-2'-O)-methyltransferase
VTRRHERNDGKSGWKPTGDRRRPPARRDADPAADDWLWGWHAALAALKNPKREKPLRVVATRERAAELARHLPALGGVEIAEKAEIDRLLPQGAVHQGLALRAGELPAVTLEDLPANRGAVVLMLDQVTDPQNVGAILRSAAAFGAVGVILQDRHAPRLAGALAKAAAGAVEQLAVVRVVNLSRALETLSDLGWRTVGLTGAADGDLAQVLNGAPTVLVLGSEGEGLRRLVAEHCDALARIPMPGGFESLNVAAAAAVSLYEASRPRA